MIFSKGPPLSEYCINTRFISTLKNEGPCNRPVYTETVDSGSDARIDLGSLKYTYP